MDCKCMNGAAALIGKFFMQHILSKSTSSQALTWSSCHVYNLLALLRSQSHNWEEGGRSLQHIVPRHILRGGTHRHIALIDHQTNLRM